MYAQKLVSKDDIDQKDKGTCVYSEHVPFTYSMRYKEVIKKTTCIAYDLDVTVT